MKLNQWALLIGGSLGAGVVLFAVWASLPLTDSDYCYNRDFPLMRTGWNGTAHSFSYIHCMREMGHNPFDPLTALATGRDF